MWAGMIALTSGVCRLPVLSALWCSPVPGVTVPAVLTWWDWVLLVVFVGAGWSAAGEMDRR